MSDPYSRPLFRRLIELTLRDENVIWLEGVMPVMTELRPRTSDVDSEERPVFVIILKKLVDWYWLKELAPVPAKTVEAPILRSFERELMPRSKSVLSCLVIDVDKELICMEKSTKDDSPCDIDVLRELTGALISIVLKPQPTTELKEDRPCAVSTLNTMASKMLLNELIVMAVSAFEKLVLAF
jgi:hypothetical protein